MNKSLVLNDSSHSEKDAHEIQIFEAQIVAATLSLLLGLTSATSNILLLLTLHKDPLKCFRRRATTVFIKGLAASDFLAGIIVQPIYATSLLFEVTGRKIQVLYAIASIGSHVGTKISILTLVAIAVDRLLAIALPWKYNTIVTRKRAAITNIIIWLSVGTFEATHSEPSLEEVLHAIDLHLQTTVPMIGLLIISIATYLAFRKYSRNAVFAQSENRSNRIHVRNLQFEKKIMVTILLIMLVVLVSLTPYLIVQKMSDNCHHDEHQDEHEEENTNCDESKEFALAKVFSVSLLCLSCALNPTLYAWRIPHYRQSLKMVVNAARRRRGSVVALVQDVPIPSLFRLTEGNSHDDRDSVLAWNSLPRSTTNIRYVKPLK
jgi:hypothetical protein